MDQDCRRLSRRGGFNELMLPTVKNPGKISCFSPIFLMHTENLPAVEAGGRLCSQGNIGRFWTKPSPPRASPTLEPLWNYEQQKAF